MFKDVQQQEDNTIEYVETATGRTTQTTNETTRGEIKIQSGFMVTFKHTLAEC